MMDVLATRMTPLAVRTTAMFTETVKYHTEKPQGQELHHQYQTPPPPIPILSNVRAERSTPTQ